MRLDQVILRGTFAARPSAATLPNGSLYASTDTNEIYEVVAAAWVLFVDGDGGAGGAGTVTDVTAGVGLDGGTITVSGTIDLADTAVTPATYGDDAHVAQVTIDQQGRITAASEVAIAGGGGGAPLWNLNLATYAGNLLAPAVSAGNFSVGNIIHPIRPNLKTTGISFWWGGGAGALTVKAQLRRNGSKTSATAAYSTIVATVTGVAVNAAGVYTATFASEQTLTEGEFHAVQVYEESGTKFPANSTWANLKMNTQVIANNWTMDPSGLQLVETGFAAGDAAIAADAGTSAFYPVSLIVSG
jgi:hypothetical protein